MSSPRDPDPLQSTPALEGTQVAVLGYDDDARDHALALRRAGNTVTIGALPDSPAWWRARSDGFDVEKPGTAVATAEVVVVRSTEDETLWRQGEPRVRAGALVVFASARALHVGACATSGMDVVYISKVDDERVGCRIAVHRDVTRRALVRAITYARAAFPTTTLMRSTSVAAEHEYELMGPERSGKLLALAVSSPLTVVQPGEPSDDEADDKEDAAGEDSRRNRVGPW